MNEIDRVEDKVMAMEFAFMCLAKALHEQGALRLPMLAEHLRKASDQMLQAGGLEPVAEQLAELRVTLLQLQ